MSLRMLNLVFHMASTNVTLMERMVLLSLANYSNDGGSNAYPSVPRIAADTSMTRRSVQRTLKRLRDKGLVTEAGRMSRGAVRYELALSAIRDCDRGSQSAAATATNSRSPLRPIDAPGASHSHPTATTVARDCDPQSPDPDLIRSLTVTDPEEHRASRGSVPDATTTDKSPEPTSAERIAEIRRRMAKDLGREAARYRRR